VVGIKAAVVIGSVNDTLGINEIDVMAADIIDGIHDLLGEIS
jgi:hypothetical protein